MKDMRILVVGASMGGIKMFPKLVAHITPDMPIATFIVQHIFSGQKSQLARILSNHTQTPIKTAEDGEAIQAGHIYVSPSDQHLIVKNGHMALSYGPQENGSRPSINALFRSAAVSYRQKVIGVLLTGLLSDGAQGMKAIHDCGGATIVQDPEEAPFDEMPRNALKVTNVDHVALLKEIPALLADLLNKPVTDNPTPVPIELERQVAASLTPLTQIVEQDASLPNNFQKPTFPVNLDDSLWSVLQYMQERTTMLENLMESERIRGRSKLARDFELRAQESRAHTENLRAHLLELELGHSTTHIIGSSGLPN
ncbi:MAG: chemotaxis protein CheB [Cyclobacteriaceae bacterium]|jgi:two-component system chemotaxis response regulator CheB